MTEDVSNDWRTPAQRESDIAQARVLREKASEGGLRFEVYLPSGLAEWILDFVERGIFVDPSEAVFVILGEHKDLEPHHDLRQEVLTRSLQAAMDEASDGVEAKEFFVRLEEEAKKPRPPVAVWQKQTYD